LKRRRTSILKLILDNAAEYSRRPDEIHRNHCIERIGFSLLQLPASFKEQRVILRSLTPEFPTRAFENRCSLCLAFNRSYTTTTIGTYALVVVVYIKRDKGEKKTSFLSMQTCSHCGKGKESIAQRDNVGGAMGCRIHTGHIVPEYDVLQNACECPHLIFSKCYHDAERYSVPHTYAYGWRLDL